jgi:hypothetical protein
MTLKKCGFAGTDRDDIDDGSFVVVVLNVLWDLVPAVTLFQSFIIRSAASVCSILLRVPSAVVIPAKLFSYERLCG